MGEGPQRSHTLSLRITGYWQLKDVKQSSYSPENLSLEVHRVNFSGVRTIHEACWLFQNERVGEEKSFPQEGRNPRAFELGESECSWVWCTLCKDWENKGQRNGEARSHLPGVSGGQHWPSNPVFFWSENLGPILLLHLCPGTRELDVCVRGTCLWAEESPELKSWFLVTPSVSAEENFSFSITYKRWVLTLHRMQLSCLIYKFWTYFQPNPGPCPSWHSWLIRALLQFFWKAWVSLRWGRCSTEFNGPYCHAISPEHVLRLPPSLTDHSGAWGSACPTWNILCSVGLGKNGLWRSNCF